ncbi:putative secreted protein [Streptomyces sp. Tu6071]|uniref:hypothetical protein n=1 Tax=Streptomyces sp. Tu6071 TaxID=355249 RepID=UPI00020E5F58|nr:hypothetical protein [Streptomyces sp. Tu6071]EGJ77950.1 putative secreted protein [Streptomyces sp. Tu6071]
MKKRSFTPDRSATGAKGRLALGALVLVVLLAVAGLVGYLTRPDGAPAAHIPAASPAPTGRDPSSPAPAEDVPEAEAVPPSKVLEPPSTSDPLTYAKAAAIALWSYDTRSTTQVEHLALLERWLTPEKQVVDRESVEEQVPSPTLWTEMSASEQYATATATEARYPEAFARALRQDPARLGTAYVYAVTVTGHQSIAWKGHTKAGAETRTATLAVQCWPQRPCALAGALPAVAP